MQKPVLRGDIKYLCRRIWLKWRNSKEISQFYKKTSYVLTCVFFSFLLKKSNSIPQKIETYFPIKCWSLIFHVSTLRVEEADYWCPPILWFFFFQDCFWFANNRFNFYLGSFIIVICNVAYTTTFWQTSS